MRSLPGAAAFHTTRGFTLIEVVIVMVIAAVLIALVVPSVGSALGQRDVNGARDNIAMTAAMARSRAVERGRTVEFRLDVAGNKAAIIENGEVIGGVDVGARGVQMKGEASLYRLCYTARGFASASCTNVAAPTDVVFERGEYKAELTLWALGQVTTP